MRSILPQLHRHAGHLGRPVGAHRQRQPGADGSTCRRVPRGKDDLAEGGWPFAWSRRRRLHRGKPDHQWARQPDRHRFHSGGAGLARRRNDTVQTTCAERRAVDRQRRAEPGWRAGTHALCAQPRIDGGRRAKLAAAHRNRLSRAAGFGGGLPDLVPAADGDRGDRGERLSLPDAAARHAVRLAAAQRARCLAGSHRSPAGRARYLSGNTYGAVPLQDGDRRYCTEAGERSGHPAARRFNPA